MNILTGAFHKCLIGCENFKLKFAYDIETLIGEFYENRKYS